MSVFTQGHIYWLAERKLVTPSTKMFVFSFNIDNETFGTVSLPPLIMERNCQDQYNLIEFWVGACASFILKLSAMCLLVGTMSGCCATMTGACGIYTVKSTCPCYLRTTPTSCASGIGLTYFPWLTTVAASSYDHVGSTSKNQASSYVDTPP